MSATQPLPRLFGPYVLTRELGRDPLGEVYRAGTVAGAGLKPFLLVRTLSGPAIARDALLPVMETAVEYLEDVKGPAVAKGAVLGVVDDLPFAGIEYVPGRTLDRLFSGGEHGPVALPIEHALLIAEKTLLSLEAGKPYVKATGAPHGFLVPGFVFVSNDGDIRVFGAGLGPGLVASVKNPSFSAAFGPYIAPEVAASGRPSPAGDLYSAAVILLEALTGKTPAPGAGPDALSGAVLALNGNSLPSDIKNLLSRALTLDAGRRASDVLAYRKDLGKLLYGGPYAPSTFNLAFFMHQQFEKSIEMERREIAQEEQIDVKPLAAAEEQAARPAKPAAPAPTPDITVPKFGGDKTIGGTPVGKKAGLGGVPVPAVIAGVVVLGGVALWLTLGRAKPQPPPPPPPTAVPAPPTAVPTEAPPPTPVLAGKDDPEFQKAVAAKLAEEDQKMAARRKQEQSAAEKRQQAELAKAAEESRKVKQAEDALKSANERADQEEASRLAREAQEARLRQDAARAAAEAAMPKTKEGDLVEIETVDSVPKTLKIVKPEPTTMALRQHVSGTVIMKVLVDENGRAASIETVRDTSPKVGLADACKKALQSWEWAPAMKDGKKVKAWIVVPIPFQKL